MELLDCRVVAPGRVYNRRKVVTELKQITGKTPRADRLEFRRVQARAFFKYTGHPGSEDDIESLALALDTAWLDGWTAREQHVVDEDLVRVVRAVDEKWIAYIIACTPDGTDFSQCTEPGGYLLTLAAAVEKDVLSHQNRYKNRKEDSAENKT